MHILRSHFRLVPLFLLVCGKAALDAFFKVPIGSVSDHGSGSQGNVKSNIKFSERIWATKAILAKRFLLACRGITFELTLHVLILFTSVNVARFSFFIGPKKYAVLRLINLLLINSFIAFFQQYLQTSFQNLLYLWPWLLWRSRVRVTDSAGQ